MSSTGYSLASVLAVALLLAGCGRDAVEPPNYCEEPTTRLLPWAGPALDLVPLESQASPFDDAFAAAAAAHDVPASLLRAIAWTETRWQMVEGREEHGRPAPYGVMALRGERLEAGARLAGVTADRARTEPAANIRAAAALLDSYAAETGIDRSRPAAWAPVIEWFSGIDGVEGRMAYARQVRGARERGLLRLAGGELATAPLNASFATAALADDEDCIPRPPDSNAGPDYPYSVWRPSPNFNIRNGDSTGIPHMIIIHTCEGAYTGCWSWLTTIVSQVSSHYVIDEVGTEVSQLVREEDRAWHIAARYRCWLNEHHDCWLNDVQSNHFTIGIEHAGFAAQSQFPESQIETSAALVCDITRDRSVPRDWQHIVGHGQLQPENRTDPGDNWPWVPYIHRVQALCGETVVDDHDAYNDAAVAAVEIAGTWVPSDSTPDYYARGYRWAATDPAADDAVTFRFHLDSAATRTIDVRWTAGSNRSTAASYLVIDAAGDTLASIQVDQTTDGGAWNELGSWSFPAGWNRVALLKRAAAGAVVVADAIRVRE